MAATPTTTFGYNKPAQGDTDWGTTTNNNWDAVDADLALEHNHEGGVATHGNTKKLRCQIVANAAARVAIAAPREGDLVWQSDTDAFYVYDGAAWDLIGGGVSGYATGNVWLPAAAMWPSTTKGCAELSKSEHATNDVDIQSLGFATDDDDHAQTTLALPHDWDGGTITAVFYWTCSGGGAAETVEWNIQGRSYGDDEAIDQAWGTTQAVSDTWIADGDIHITSATGACTVAGTPAALELVQLRIFRDVSDDDLGVDADLIGVMITYTRS